MTIKILILFLLLLLLLLLPTKGLFANNTKNLGISIGIKMQKCQILIGINLEIMKMY